MRPKESNLAGRLHAGVRKFDQRNRKLPGIRVAANCESFVEQLVESIRRIRYVSVVSNRDISDLRADPSSELFDPIRAAVLRQRQGDIEEAFWLVFIFVHFGKNIRTGWRLARDVYGRLGGGVHWDWARTSSSPKRFREWLAAHQATLQGGDGVARRFGNHRKYESLDAASANGTGAAVESYVRWIGPPGTHAMLIQKIQKEAGGAPRKTFDRLYHSMDAVARFGRTARFDYLTMIGKLGLAPIEPGSAYMQGATGPLAGARLLFGGSKTASLGHRELDELLVQLEAEVDFGMQGMQVLEDALCNWQKSPSRFKPFRG